MQVEVVPLTDFQHGRVVFRADHPATIAESTANDLERAGLVRVKMVAPFPHTQDPPPARRQDAPPHRTQEAPPVRTPAPPDPLGKARADGEGTPSASLQAAPVSPATIAVPPKRGRGRPRKIVT